MADCATCDPSKIMHVSVISVFAFLALMSLIFRLWARMIKRNRLEWNDYLCVGGLVFTLASTSVSVHSYVYWGFFSRSVAGDSDIVVLQYKALLVGQLLWITAVTLIRASVLFLYNRIFCTKSFRIACYGILSINLAYFTATVLACCLICRPFAFNWDQSIHGSCGDQKSLDLFIGVFNLLMDITTVALPMPVLWGLQMPTGTKIVLSGLFSMGIAICIITLVRIKVTTDITANNTAGQYALIALLTCLESSLGVVNACLPVTKPVFEKLKPTLLISLLWGRTSSKPKVLPGDYELPSRLKRVGWPLEDRPKRIMQPNPQDSTTDVSNEIWRPPSSPHQDFEQ
ncbi:hypothetical protein HO133_003521 [Letharia lupina]|uniref:Rhodopsin domain-containing protein n=1 Tax=Letharia lupina TaxID=560253 RepID=A0A8H6CBU6_9LECA|nr:uncharacterized protein HO133_003521 [Letharia lupina]KAF6220389.1 hypothetical protein HO133_003521 [Letharia lupina]